jgi:hypothetical protein
MRRLPNRLARVETESEATAYLKSLGFYACERILLRERVVFVAADPVRSQSGMLAFRKAILIRRFHYSWTILELKPKVPPPVHPFVTLQEACDEVAAILGRAFRIPVEA